MSHTSFIESTRDHVMPAPGREFPQGGGKDRLPVLTKEQHLPVLAKIFDVVPHRGDDQVRPLGIPEADEIARLHSAEKGHCQVHHLSSAKTISVFLKGVTRVDLEADCVLQTGRCLTCYLAAQPVGQFQGVIAWGLAAAIVSSH